MPRVTTSDLDPVAAERVRRMAAEQGLIAAPAPVANRVAKQSKLPANPDWWQGKEGDLQKACNAMLVARGYWKRDKRGILAGSKPPMGWQVHVARAIGNPYLLDVLLLGNDGRYFEGELKHATGKASEIQEALMASDGTRIYRSVAELRAAVEDWEAKGVHG